MIVKQPFPSYNHRRYGTPWGAKVTFPDGIKPEYEFLGHYDGDWKRGGSGDVLLNAEVGDVLAFGQRDYGGKRTQKFFVIVGDTENERVNEAKARDHYNANKTTSG